jgi:arylsulfatase A-like enzyme
MPALTSQRPNLLFITTDQQRHDTIAAAGNRRILTPHLSWLLESGIHFTRAYSESPVCCPARGTMITGRHYHNTPSGIASFGQPTTETPSVTLPALLTRAGYQTKAVGKLHYHPPRCNYGWEDAEILEDYYRTARRAGLSPAEHGVGQNEVEPAISTVPAHQSLTHWTVQQSIDFLETRDPTRPFCLYTSFSKPHPPFDPCADFWHLYDRIDMDDPISSDWAHEVHPAWMSSTWQLCGGDRLSPEVVRQIRRAYYALITQVDYTLGLLISRLREMNLLESTLIVFTSDHGEMLGDHGMWAKASPFEGSMHVPMIVRPHHSDQLNALRGTKSDAIASVLDIFRTFTSAAGVDVPAGVAPDSIDLIAQARGEVRRERMFGAVGGWHCVLEGSFKYAFHEAGGAEILFDLASDPLEQRELVRAGTHAVQLDRMRHLVVDYATQRRLPVARDGRLIALREPLDRQSLRAQRSWPGFHHPGHTPECLMH